MIEITYLQMVIAISLLWLLVRAVCWIKAGRLDLKREAQLLLVYACLLVVVRITFCPLEGLQPLVFDPQRIFPLWVNFVPFVYLLDYPNLRVTLLNVIGNTAMFIPLGVVWPAVFRDLNTHWKVVAAGVGVSLTIEVLQLPFFDRATDVDDLILNTLGYLLGYGSYLLVKKLGRKRVC